MGLFDTGSGVWLLMATAPLDKIPSCVSNTAVPREVATSLDTLDDSVRVFA